MLQYIYYKHYKNDIYMLYLYYIRHRINNIQTPNDIINIFKNINFFYKNITSDTLNTIIIDCISYYPLKSYEIQYFSILQQKYSHNLGIENYVTFVFWICIITHIKENHFFLN